MDDVPTAEDERLSYDQLVEDMRSKNFDESTMAQVMALVEESPGLLKAYDEERR